MVKVFHYSINISILTKIFLSAAIILSVKFPGQAQKRKLIDKNATKETKALFKNLQKLSKKHTLFGHQHATEYGHGWTGGQDKSDVKMVTGSHPAVIGVDISGFSGRPPQAIQRAKESVTKTVVDTYNRGG